MANSEAICAPLQIKHVHSSMQYQQVIHPKCDRHGHELPGGYGPLRIDNWGFGPFCSTGTKLLLSIPLLMVLICIIYYIYIYIIILHYRRRVSSVVEHLSANPKVPG